MIEAALQVFGWLAIAYFATLSVIYLVFTLIAARELRRYRHTRETVKLDQFLGWPLLPPIAVLVTAYNERAGIVESVNSLLRLHYNNTEIIVINDGSTDDTLEVLDRAFDLRPIRKSLQSAPECAPIRGAFVSRSHPQIVVIDKENGGKADALNAGLRAAESEYVCALDADAILESEALLRVAMPVIEDPKRVVAVGGTVRIINGCEVSGGAVTKIGLPSSWVARFQVVEYLRAFLVGRVGWSKLRSLLIVSGAFGLFRREDLISAGGYWSDTVGEDMELILRLHRHLEEKGADYAIRFVADPVCWTEAPEDLQVLSRQRRRWQRGLAECLWRHRSMLGRPRYGAVGALGLPFFWIFELLGPLVEVGSVILLPLGFATGAITVSFFLLFLAVAVLLGMILSVMALLLEQLSFRRYLGERDLLRLLVTAIAENLGYRQLTSWWRLRAFWELRRPAVWGEMPRKGIGTSAGASAGASAGGAGVAEIQVLGAPDEDSKKPTPEAEKI